MLRLRYVVVKLYVCRAIVLKFLKKKTQEEFFRWSSKL